jgi:hypothetical protein
MQFRVDAAVEGEQKPPPAPLDERPGWMPI